MDAHRKIKECLWSLVGSVQAPVDDPVTKNTSYGGVLVDTPEGPKMAYLRLTFEEPPKPTS